MNSRRLHVAADPGAGNVTVALLTPVAGGDCELFKYRQVV
jgi:hypothetical protein